MKKINIAIDGPSAAGKSTIAKALAKRLGYIHLDTGAMYRCVAYKALQNNISWEDEEALLAMLATTEITFDEERNVYLDGENVSLAIRANEISMGASNVSKLKGVRADLVARQQKLALNKGYILDGRDIGSVVLKDAELKIFQTASVETRAQRRHKENLEKGIESDYEAIKADIEQRDYQDTHRAESPLIKVEDAIELNTSDMTIEESVNAVYELVLKIIG